jgi:hypothetical protein
VNLLLCCILTGLVCIFASIRCCKMNTIYAICDEKVFEIMGAPGIWIPSAAVLTQEKLNHSSNGSQMSWLTTAVKYFWLLGIGFTAFPQRHRSVLLRSTDCVNSATCIVSDSGLACSADKEDFPC